MLSSAQENQTTRRSEFACVLIPIYQNCIAEGVRAWKMVIEWMGYQNIINTQQMDVLRQQRIIYGYLIASVGI